MDDQRIHFLSFKTKHLLWRSSALPQNLNVIVGNSDKNSLFSPIPLWGKMNQGSIKREGMTTKYSVLYKACYFTSIGSPGSDYTQSLNLLFLLIIPVINRSTYLHSFVLRKFMCII